MDDLRTPPAGPNSDQPAGGLPNHKQRIRLGKVTRWFRVVFVGWWALTILAVVVVALIKSSEEGEAFDWTTTFIALAAGLLILPFGLFILGRVRGFLEGTAGSVDAKVGEAGGPLKQAEEKRVGRLKERMLTGGFGLILTCGGSLGLITGKVFESSGPRDAPVAARVLGGILVLAGIFVLSAAVSRDRTDEKGQGG